MHKDHVDLGLDTIEYLPKDGDMVSVILHSDSFTSEEAEAAYNSEYVKYDGYCQSNDREAADRLLNGLGIDLRKDIDQFYDSTNGLIVVWYGLRIDVKKLPPPSPQLMSIFFAVSLNAEMQPLISTWVLRKSGDTLTQ